MMSIFNKADEVSRRNFVRGAAGSLLGVSLISPILADEKTAAKAIASGKAKSVIYLYMSGGMSHLDSFDIKPENADVRGKAGELKTSADGVRVSQYFPGMAKVMDKCAVINSMSSTAGAHEQGRYLMHTSYTQRGTIQHPHMGAWVGKLAGKISKTLPSFVKVGGGGRTLGGGFFEPQYAALPVGAPDEGLKYSKRHRTVSEKVFDNRIAMLEKMNGEFQTSYKQKQVKAYGGIYKDAVSLMTGKDLDAFDISKETDATTALYGESKFGQGCLLARRLVEGGVRYVEVNLGGWDNHGNIYDSFPTRSADLDKGMSALIADLTAKGLLDSTLVVLATEFGRTPKINQNAGRDHYPKAFSCVLAGGGIKGGQTYGKTDEAGKTVIDKKVKPEDFNATIAHSLGLSTDQVLLSPSGRPFQIAHKGKAITSLF
jgi:hypothetical protein